MSQGARAVVMVTVAVMLAACGAEADAGAEPFSEEIARKLLPDAASMDPVALDTLLQLGGAVTPHDVKGHLSLTALVLTTRVSAWPPEGQDELKISPKTTPRDVLSAWYGGEMPSKPDPSRRPTVLHAKAITGVTVAQEGDAAKGVVTFRSGDMLSGAVHYEARRTDGAWAITAFEFPQRGARLERKQDGWALTKSPIAFVPVQLPVVADQGIDAPARPRITVTLAADGSAHFEGQSFDLAADDPVVADTAITALGSKLSERVKAGKIEPDGSCALDFVLVADARGKWKFAQWILQSAAQARIYRTHFALLPGPMQPARVFKAFLPRDRGLAASAEFPAVFAKVKIKVFRRNLVEPSHEHYTLVKVDNTHSFSLPKGWPASGTPATTASYRETIDKIRQVVRMKAKFGGDDVKGEIVAPPPKGGSVPIEDALNMLGVLHGAGIEDITFEGRAMPLTRREREARNK